jgi:hypothetical protein
MGRVILTNYLNSHPSLRYSGHTAIKLVKRGCFFRLRRKTIPQHCTTILKTSFKIVCFRFWKCYISIILRRLYSLLRSLIFINFSLRLGADCSLRILYIKTLFSLWRLTSSVDYCRSSSTFAELTSNLAPVITRAALFWSTCNLSLWTSPHVSHKGEQ